MIRPAVLAAFVAALLAPAALAQPGTFRVVEATAAKGKLTWTETQMVPSTREVEVTVNVNGKNVVEKKTITVFESVTVTREAELKGVKVTDGAGKAVAADKVAELLKDKASVVLVSGLIPEKHRALFKETTVFVELPNAAPVAPPGGVPAVPAGEKKG